jgi:lipoyl synthase
VVITAVARDDLPDEGARHFAACVAAVRRKVPEAGIEVLPADFHGRRECISILCDASPDIYNHNIETVERITPLARPKADYRRSLDVLRIVKDLTPSMTTKSGLMVGFGETIEEVNATLGDLRQVGCDIVTIGQYLQPASDRLPVTRYYPPEEFDRMAEFARRMGFRAVAAGPFVRSSYNAGEVFAATAKQGGQEDGSRKGREVGNRHRV